MKTHLYAAPLVLLLAASAPALAAQDEVPQIIVEHSDLDLKNPHGMAALERRVKSAVRRVCDGPDFTLREKMHQRECMREAGDKAAGDVAEAVRQAWWGRTTWPMSGGHQPR